MENKLNKQIKNKSSNKVKNKVSKIVIKDKNKFYKTIGVFGVVLVLIVVMSIFGNKIIEVDNNTNIQKINIRKHSSEVKQYYDGLMNEFITDHNNMQNQVWSYIYNQIIDGGTVEDLIDPVNKILKSGNLEKLGIEESSKWRGTYRIDKDSNVLLFKFETKNIEPTWIDEPSVNYMIEKNWE